MLYFITLLITIDASLFERQNEVLQCNKIKCFGKPNAKCSFAWTIKLNYAFKMGSWFMKLMPEFLPQYILSMQGDWAKYLFFEDDDLY